MNAGKRVIQEYVAATIDGSLANVFVRLQGNFPQTPVSTQPVIDRPALCVHAAVVGVRVGQTVQIKNSDTFLHNLTACPARTTASTSAQPRAGQVYEFKPKNEEVMLHLKCDVHNWMNAYIGIVTNPYFAVTNTMGTSKSTKSTGTYTIQIWHERYGPVMKTVTVKAGAVATMTSHTPAMRNPAWQACVS
jgi:plastocyanin